jgi:hypothetical protein
MTPAELEENAASPAVHSGRVRGELKALIDHLQADHRRMDDPHYRAMLQVSAEMLKGVHNAFVNFDEARRKIVHLSQ